MENKDLCPALLGPCDREKCPVLNVIPGIALDMAWTPDQCPIKLDPDDSLQAIKDALREAGRYLDQVLGLEGEGDIIEKLQRSLQEGKIDFKKIGNDLLALEDGDEE